jgi:hypothetical protein
VTLLLKQWTPWPAAHYCPLPAGGRRRARQERGVWRKQPGPAHFLGGETEAWNNAFNTWAFGAWKCKIRGPVATVSPQGPGAMAARALTPEFRNKGSPQLPACNPSYSAGAGGSQFEASPGNTLLPGSDAVLWLCHLRPPGCRFRHRPKAGGPPPRTGDPERPATKAVLFMRVAYPPLHAHGARVTQPRVSLSRAEGPMSLATPLCLPADVIYANEVRSLCK